MLESADEFTWIDLKSSLSFPSYDDSSSVLSIESFLVVGSYSAWPKAKVLRVISVDHLRTGPSKQKKSVSPIKISLNFFKYYIY